MKKYINVDSGKRTVLGEVIWARKWNGPRGNRLARVLWDQTRLGWIK